MYVHLSAPHIQLIFPPGEGTESELALSFPLAPCLLFLIFLSDKEWISFLLETILSTRFVCLFVFKGMISVVVQFGLELRSFLPEPWQY